MAVAPTAAQAAWRKKSRRLGSSCGWRLLMMKLLLLTGGRCPPYGLLLTVELGGGGDQVDAGAGAGQFRGGGIGGESGGVAEAIADGGPHGGGHLVGHQQQVQLIEQGGDGHVALGAAVGVEVDLHIAAIPTTAGVVNAV